MKVFGVGMIKTGTSSLGTSLTNLGFKHFDYHPKLIRQVSRGEYSDVWDIVGEYDSFEDNPWPMIYEMLDERVPDARFVLTERRDSEVWFRSMEQHARRMGPTVERKIVYGHAWPSRHKREHIEQYEAHNAAVRAHFAGRSDKLLVVCWETGSTADDVADFLGIAPAAAVTGTPWSNSGRDQKVMPRFWARNLAKYALISGLRFDPFRHR